MLRTRLTGQGRHSISKTSISPSRSSLNFRRFYLYILHNDRITIMGYSKHEPSTINMWYSLNFFFILHPYFPITATSPQRPLSSVPKCGQQVRLYCNQFSPIRLSVLPFVFAVFQCLNFSKSRVTASFNKCGNVEKVKKFFRPASASLKLAAATSSFPFFPRFPRQNVRLCNPALRP